jgi:hypothetical protein
MSSFILVVLLVTISFVGDQRSLNKLSLFRFSQEGGSKKFEKLCLFHFHIFCL